MPAFPRTESEVIALAEAMVAGYTAHAADFPSVTVATLSTALSTFQTNRQAQISAQSQAQLATETKGDKLDALIELMKNDLKKSEVDTASDPTKLAEIGWAPRSQPAPVDPPGQPDNFHPTAEGPGDVWLEWESPATGGLVRNYIIECRERAAGGTEFGDWSVVGTSLNTDTHLLEQPRGTQLEYRVKAANVSGESMPSNTAAVVL
ncbi:MAG: fibronectin type III domain-containing protein [Sedimentisphaerales bacterium]